MLLIALQLNSGVVHSPQGQVKAAFERLYASELSGGWDKASWDLLRAHGNSGLAFLLIETRNSDQHRRWLAVAVLGSISAGDAADRLREVCSSDPSQLVRLEAIRNMAKFPGPPTEQLLERILAKPLEADTVYAGRALKHLNPSAANRSIRSTLRQQRAVWTTRANNVRLMLLDVLLESNPVDRDLAIDVIADLHRNHGKYAQGYMDKVTNRLGARGRVHNMKVSR